MVDSQTRPRQAHRLLGTFALLVTGPVPDLLPMAKPNGEVLSPAVEDQFLRSIDLLIVHWESQRGRMPDVERLRHLCWDVAFHTVRFCLDHSREPDGPGL